MSILIKWNLYSSPRGKKVDGFVERVLLNRVIRPTGLVYGGHPGCQADLEACKTH
jgi:hypothetical protein